ncbi:hypothetical protein [Pseudomonas sp. Teo4]|uniref:hypothetical protein n=1 Tax=Pseudomonas sp. Teo4 TaxID=3064528 RepID=UPI002AB81842|nr:hypothetical protein [Pseudomonas sp. Teo4]MDZ3992298.1 hypothetical protein [Pseudomonas sp. Teo4]
MTTFDIVGLLGAIAGLSMVLGGIWLVAKGAITMAATPAADAITIEWKRQFRINTQVPGVAFFLVGLLFIALSLAFLKPNELEPIEFEGEIKNLKGRVSVVVRPVSWGLADSDNGVIAGRVYPDLSVLVVQITAAGYETLTTPVRIIDEGRLIAKIGAIELTPSNVTESDLKKQISPLPFTPPPITDVKVGKFGAPL